MNQAKKTAVPVAYKVDDQELLLDFYKKALWNRMIPRIPASIAPNTITIVGQLMALLAIPAAYLATTGAPIMYLVSALLLLGYLTADNVDGPHARRTGQASPLGEFLDHGLDGIASGAVLLITGLVLRADPIPMVLLGVLGAIGFIMVFWEQFRTGLLVIPRVSSTEGVTFLMVIELILFFAQDPTWLQFSMAEFNLATAIIIITLVGYAAAMAPPIIRGAHAGAKGWELLPVFALAGSYAVFPALGGQAIIPTIAVGVFGADVVCRMIVMRHQGHAGRLLSPLHFLMLVPALGAVAAPNAWTVTGWSTLTLIITVGLYARTLHRGIIEMIARHEKAQAHVAS
ncbi:MAG: hypothetical protein CVU56_13575 [Deltaproteobacteria bacterium HGW-Deltaproteobacteria-14]|nr:MAG: hypothetical protein CVU56_13575 [Deltaproteobacteria bacterium HGW-Deltaproteobacteria-14]